MNYMALIVSGTSYGVGIACVLIGISGHDHQNVGVGGIILALSAIACAIVGLTKG